MQLAFYLLGLLPGAGSVRFSMPASAGVSVCSCNVTCIYHSHSPHCVSLPSVCFQYLCHVYNGLTFFIISILCHWHVTERDLSNSSSKLPYSLRSLN